MHDSLIILIDIGNTSTSVALEQGKQFVLVKRFSSRGQTTRKIGTFLRAFGRKINGAILCSVVPALDKIWLKELKRMVAGKILRVNHRMKLGISINYSRPSSIGADRLANAVGACEKYGAPVIVADFGTALTFDIVSAKRAYLGGIIAPGPALFMDYLAERTALLPRMSLASLKRKQKSIIGKSTQEAMLIGLRTGYIGMLREIIRRIKKEPGLKNARLCATGGLAGMVLTGSGLKITIDPLLTLRGISRIYWLNS
jgi:type III pantothenate kinase